MTSELGKSPRLQTREVDLVVVGLGYVGLPLIQEACRSGLAVAGLDVNEAVVRGLNSGRSHIDDLSDEDIQAILDTGFIATSDASVVGHSKNIVICVPTPLSSEGGPDLGPVTGAAEAIAKYLSQDTLVVLESTSWPGTTDEILRPLLERSGLRAGTDFPLAFSPERIDPGNRSFGMRNTPKVVGGLTPECGVRAVALYEQFVDQVILARGSREAEMSKLLENTYRHINIALVNEMAKFSHELDIDFWDVIRCANTKPFGFQAFYPGPGVGGHCIPIDPNYLSHRVRVQLGYPFRFVELAQEINLSMPQYVASRVQDALNSLSLPVRGTRTLLLGVTYKPGIADERESPARPLARHLQAKGAAVSFYDPFVYQWHAAGQALARVDDLPQALETADIAVHLQPHGDYSEAVLTAVDTPVLDTRGVLHGSNIIRM